jgi:AcrR family transcriptional regulator
MSPRQYDNSKRQAAAEKTRQRILNAALETYLELGFTRTSIQAIAKKAEVSPGTVLNHFENGDALMVAAIETLYQQLEFPTPEVFEGISGLEERMRRYTLELGVFYERTLPWYQVHAAEPDHPTLKGVEAEFYQRLDLLTRAALGPGMRDKKTLALVQAITSPSAYGSLKFSGLGPEAAGEMLAEVLVPWLLARKKKKG